MRGAFWPKNGRRLSCLFLSFMLPPLYVLGSCNRLSNRICVALGWVPVIKIFRWHFWLSFVPIEKTFLPPGLRSAQGKAAAASNAHVDRMFVCLIFVCCDKGSLGCLVVYDCSCSFCPKTPKVLFALKWLFEMVYSNFSRLFGFRGEKVLLIKINGISTPLTTLKGNYSFCFFVDAPWPLL